MRSLLSCPVLTLAKTLVSGRGDATPAFERLSNGLFTTDVAGWAGVTWNPGGELSGVAVITSTPMSQALTNPLRGGESYTLTIDLDDTDFDPDDYIVAVALYNDNVLVQTLLSSLSTPLLSETTTSGKVLGDADELRVTIGASAISCNVDVISLVA